MRPDVVTSFMDQFGDVIYNNYNATEAGMIATATPADLRALAEVELRPEPLERAVRWLPAAVTGLDGNWPVCSAASPGGQERSDAGMSVAISPSAS